MTPKKFDYYSPRSLSEAIQLLETKEESKILAGGQSLLALMKLRLAAPKSLVDITKLEGFSYIREEKGYLAIGALTIHDMIESSPLIKEKYTLFNDAVSKIGDQQIRNRGTIGGSACHADPAADLPTALAAAEANFVVKGSKGERLISAKDFFVDIFTTPLEHEVLTEIRIPSLPAHSSSAYIKHSRREGDFAITSCGVVLTTDGSNTCRDVRIALGSVASTPLRFTNAEKFLKGKKLEEKTIVEASNQAPEGANPPSDMHGSAEYRMEMIKVFTKRSLKLALGRIK